MSERVGSRRESRGRNRWRTIGLATATLAGVAALTAPGPAAAADPVTPTSGTSLIAKLRTGVDWTAFGRAGEGDTATPPASASGAPGGWLAAGFDLSGGDLYRLDCRSCHGPDARGSRSGIPPLMGAFAPGKEDEGKAEAGEIRVRHRLVQGGRVMPPVAHLTDAEVNLLLGYLHWLADGAKGEPPGARVRQPAARVGEHIVKSTCQICHDAGGGVWRQPADRQSVIPLAEMTERLSVKEFVRKARAGSPVEGNPHGRMPRFDYLSAEELSAAYVYLTAYPPQTE